MPFDWTAVDFDDTAVRTEAGPDLSGNVRGGKWRQRRSRGVDGPVGYLEEWLRELWSWGFDSLLLDAEAEAWLDRMENEHLVLLKHDVFERARCGLTHEPGHEHRRGCAGPTGAERAAQRHIVAAGGR